MNRPLGWVSPQTLGRPPHTGAAVAPSLLATLPRAVQIASLPPVYDQGSVGSCTAQALAGAVEVLHARGGYAPERPDRVALYRRERDAIGLGAEDSGAILADGIAALRRGYEPEREHPTSWGPRWLYPAPRPAVDAPRVVSAEPLSIDVATVCWEIASGHPVAVGLSITGAWDACTGELPAPSGPSVGGHAVLLVGYDLDRRAFRVRNSWGESWGEGGYAWLPFAWLSLPWCGEAHALRAVRRASLPAGGDVGAAKREMVASFEDDPRPSMVDLLAGPVALVEQQLRASAPLAPPRPLLITARHAVTLWSGDGLPRAVRDALPLLREARPAVVQLHAGPQGLAQHAQACANVVRRELPGVRFWVGVAWDGWVDLVTAASVNRIVERYYLPAARAAHDVGAEMFVINSEAAGKLHPASARILACAAIDRIRAEFPGLAVGHTAYDHPHYHPEERNNGGRIDRDEEGYPWSAYLGGAVAREAGVAMPLTGPVDLELPQRYAAPEKPKDKPQPMAGLGALPHRVASSQASYARAAALGWIDGAVPVRCYVQAHHVDARDTASVGASQPLALWAAPTRIDDHGRRALRVLCAAERGELGADLGANDWPVITAWAQGRVGASGDGQWGAKSTAAAAAWLRARGLDGDGRFGAELLARLQSVA